ncbi:MAG: DUF1653 domain-containing protein [Candidatus Woesearchaeota archaeon]
MEKENQKIEVEEQEKVERRIEGKYKHYKGKEYEVIGIAKNSETLEEMVIYKPLYNSDTKLWVRPAKMFFEKVTVDGKEVNRFNKIEE